MFCGLSSFVLVIRVVPKPVIIVVRTGKEKRISDFFLWQVGNAQLVFLDMFWPDITKDVVSGLIESFTHERRY